ncbi:MAG: helix-hairpin-helix domain-containing protein [Promethearchaeota archaeon]
MKRAGKILLGLLIVFLLIGMQVKQIVDQSERINSGSGNLDVTVPSLGVTVDLPKKPFSLKNHVIDLMNVTSESANDTDKDGLPDPVEYIIGTDFNNTDTDFDNLTDYYEVYNDLDPLNEDTNQDGFPDYFEVNVYSQDIDGDGIKNAWDFDNDGDGVTDGIDVSPYANSTIHDKFTFNVITDGKPIYINFQLKPKNSEHLKLYYQSWNWPYDNKGSMQDLDGSTVDVTIEPWLRITPSVLPDQDAVIDRGVLVTSNSMEVSLDPTLERGSIVAFNGKMYYPEPSPINLDLEVELIWKVSGYSDIAAKALAADNGKYVCIGSNGLAVANASWINEGNQSIFQWIDLGADKVALKVPNGGYLSVEDNGTLTPTATTIGDREAFQTSQSGNDTGFKAYNNNYLYVKPDGVLMADSAVFVGFEVSDEGYYPDTIHLATYKEDFMFTGFGVEENVGCNLSLFYSDEKNQTIAANMLLTYKFIRNSTTTLADMSGILADHNVSVMNETQSYSDNYEAIVSMSNNMLPTALDSLPDDQILPVIMAMEEASKVVDMSEILGVNSSIMGGSCTINLTSEESTITKSLKTDFFNTTSDYGPYQALPIDEILNAIANWGLNDNATRTLMMMTLKWYVGEVVITRIGDNPVDFLPAEDEAIDTVWKITYIGLNAASLIVDAVLTFQAFSALKFCYMTLAYQGGKQVLSTWQVYKIVQRTNPKVIQSLKMNKMLGVISGGGKLTKVLQFITKYHILDIIGVLVGIGLSIWAGVKIANSIGGQLGQELGAAYGVAGSLWAIFTGIVLAIMFSNPFSAVLAVIFIILDLIFGISGKVIEWLAKVFFGNPHDYHHAEPYLDIEGGPEPTLDDKDNNGLDVGDRIEILMHLVGGITGHGEHPRIDDRSWVVPWISIEPPSGTNSKIGDSKGDTSSPLLTQTQVGSTGSTTLEDKYDSIAWIEPGISMINFPVKLKLNGRYNLRKEWYHRPFWYFGAKCWHDSWERGTIDPQDITTLHFDVLPGNFDDFLAWRVISKNDRDGDALTDAEEVSQGVSDKLIYDTDADGLNDKYEIEIGTDPKSCDTDEDGLLDGYEAIYGANEKDGDTDDDGIYDFLEVAGWLISFNYSGYVFTTRVFSNPGVNDTDGDGVEDGIEYWSGLNPRSPDTNGDGIKDVGVPPAEVISIIKNSTVIEQEILSYSCIISEFDVDANGNIYAPVINVSDNSYFLLKLDSNLTYLDNWSLAFRPGKIAVDAGNELLYVENTSQASVTNFVRYFLNGTGPVGNLVGTGLRGVGGIDVDTNGFIYIARNTTTQIAQIEKYFPNGTLVANFGSYGTEPDEFTNLTAVAVDNNYGIIYAIDGQRIMKFNSTDGSYVTTLPNGYQNIVDITTDVIGWVYVLDKFDQVLGEGCVRKFDHNGMEDKNFILTNTSITPPWNLVHYPMRIAIDSSKNIYVLENTSILNSGTRFLKFKENETEDPPQIDNTKYDWDGDGLWNLREVVGWNTTFRYNPWTTIAVNSSPFIRDTDFDGLTDYEEFELKSHPWDPDTDKDGLSDLVEWSIGTNLCNYDTDDDGLNDSTEILFGSNPINSSDTDADGLSDLQEFQLNSDPTKIDTDNDGANDLQEFLGNSSLLLPDTDNDFMLDGLEYDNSTDPLDPDTDDDYLMDGEELVYNTNPLNNDTDGDGAIDGMEVDLWLDPLNNDTDGDGLTDFIELEWGSNPHVNDTDYDGVPDGADLDIQINFTKPIVLAYDQDPSNHTGEFAQRLGELTNVTIVSVSNLKENYTHAPFIVLVGNPAPINNTVGGLIYELLVDTGDELAALMDNDSRHVAVRRGIWTSTQTIVMLSQAYFYDVGKVLSTLKAKNVTISPDSYIVEYQTAPIIHNVSEFYYGISTDEIDTVKATDSVISIVLGNWSLPSVQVTKYTAFTTKHPLMIINGLKFGEVALDKYLDVTVTANGTTLDDFQEAIVIIFYRLEDLDQNNDGRAGAPWDINENKLSLYYFNETTGSWIKLSKDLDWVLELGINTTDFELYGESYAGYIWMRVTHLSFFSVAGFQNVPYWNLIFQFIIVALALAVTIVVSKQISLAESKRKLDNIEWQIKNKKLLLQLNITKEFGKSSTGKTIIVANSHGSKRLKRTKISFGLVAYKYPEKKEVKRKKKEHEMQNIDIKLDGDICNLIIDTTKDYGFSTSGKSIIVASSKGNKQIEETGIFVGLNVFKIHKPSTQKPSSTDKINQVLPESKIKIAKKTKVAPIPKEFPPQPDDSKSVDTSEALQKISDKKPSKLGLQDIPGLGPAKIKLLNEANIFSIEDLINCNPQMVASKISGLGINSLNKWIQSAKKITSA